MNFPMNERSSSACLGNGDDPDISGVGVRVSFYLQTFILVLLVDRSWQDAPIALWTFIATSAGLTLAAVVQREQLTLFQALVVSDLVWLANFGTFVALASYSRQKAASHKDSTSRRTFNYNVRFGAMAQTLVSMALTLYMWAKAKTFGADSQCSYYVQYVLFVFQVPALGRGRVIGLVVTSLLTVAYSLITLHELHSYRRSSLDNSVKDKESGLSPLKLKPPIHSRDISSTSANSLSTPTSASLVTVSSTQGDYPFPVPRSQSVTIPTSPRNPLSYGKRRPKRRRWSSDLDPMLVGIIICQAMVFTYFIVSIELLLRFNSSVDKSTNQWGFGQIIALVVVIPSALSLVGAIKEHGFKRLSKRKKIPGKDREKREKGQRRRRPDTESR
ncbi:hypothetical protein BDZ94DRAFT_1316968 [Collybia nuda]|uniref:Uncharacterized protein n=1 Tax=Collybia nuda TaxID=64659 RepID=A0A9P6CQ44_9AGAR|nr:hypothetical protein BDZ94DRAFT_1316968 [Collybia nuda]